MAGVQFAAVKNAEGAMRKMHQLQQQMALTSVLMMWLNEISKCEIVIEYAIIYENQILALASDRT